jgi:hypothetical protein
MDRNSGVLSRSGPGQDAPKCIGRAPPYRPVSAARVHAARANRPCAASGIRKMELTRSAAAAMPLQLLLSCERHLPRI